MFRETPSSMRKAFSSGGLKAFRGRRKRRKLMLGPHVSCPVCGSHFKEWIGVARHMLNGSHVFEQHWNMVEKITGKKIAQLRGKGSLALISKALEEKYGRSI